MQDLSRFKKKEYIEINTRYVSMLLIGSIALVGLVFAMGLLIGSKRGSDSVVCETPDLLTRLNEQVNEPTPPADMKTRSFHTTLTKSAETVPTPASLKPAMGETADSLVDPALQKQELETVPLQKPRLEETPVPEKVPEAEDGTYTLQVGSFQDQREASLLVKKLERAGHSAFLVSVSMPERGGRWFRVRVGPFNSKKTAWNYKLSFEQKERMPAFVVKRRG